METAKAVLVAIVGCAGFVKISLNLEEGEH